MTETQLEDAILRAAYKSYCDRFQRSYWKDGHVMSFEEWVAYLPDEAKEDDKYDR